MARYLLFAGLALISGCNTMAGLGDDMAYYGASLSQHARSAAAPGVQGSSVAGPTVGAASFSPGERVALAKPAVLRERPAIDAPIVGYAQPGETYEVFAQERDWVQIGKDQPIAWVFDTFLTGAAAED
jgi:predicted small secreted protein